MFTVVLFIVSFLHGIVFTVIHIGFLLFSIEIRSVEIGDHAFAVGSVAWDREAGIDHVDVSEDLTVLGMRREVAVFTEIGFPVIKMGQINNSPEVFQLRVKVS